jgi:hypothetical protein
MMGKRSLDTEVEPEEFFGKKKSGGEEEGMMGGMMGKRQFL